MTTPNRGDASIHNADSVSALAALYAAERTVMAVLYAIVLFLLAASYKSTFGINIEKMDEWAKSAHDAFPDQFKTTHGY